MQTHCLEIVATDVGAVCSAYAAAVEAGAEVPRPPLGIRGRGLLAMYRPGAFTTASGSSDRSSIRQGRT